ncbi:MAG: MBL fold hydrolase [Saprospiraceae bacterium]|nr:MAG: MBL fold hydrolase [Saprospiraceae bacterium]
MAKTSVISFTFNPFSENTYLVIDESKECIIIDPGCYTHAEKKELETFIEEQGLVPVRLLNTHCHIDHVFGNQFVANRWNLGLEIHRLERPILEAVPLVAQFYGVPIPEPSPAPSRFIEPGEVISFGQTELEVLFTPGHSPGHIALWCETERFVIAGDVLFKESIGRTDLPGGDFDTLIQSIKSQLFPLGDDVWVFPGHGPKTTIGHERRYNPFL